MAWRDVHRKVERYRKWANVEYRYGKTIGISENVCVSYFSHFEHLSFIKCGVVSNM